MVSRIFRNKYILTAVAFAVWMLFFDDRDVITTHFKQRSEVNRMARSLEWYKQEIELTRQELNQLKTSPALLEKYAREKYRMKKDNEDLFIISPETVQ